MFAEAVELVKKQTEGWLGEKTHNKPTQLQPPGVQERFKEKKSMRSRENTVSSTNDAEKIFFSKFGFPSTYM